MGNKAYENHDISKADVLLFLFDPLPWLEEFKCLNWSHFPGWSDLNVYIRATALAVGRYLNNYISVMKIKYFKRILEEK